MVIVAVRLVSLSTLRSVTGWSGAGVTRTPVCCGMKFVPVRMTSTLVPGSPLDGLIATSVGAGDLAALSGGTTTDGLVTVLPPHAQASTHNAIAKSLVATQCVAQYRYRASFAAIG